MSSRRRFLLVSASAAGAVRAQDSLRLSEPRPYRTVDLTWVSVKDGVRLAVRLWLPEGADQRPVPAVTAPDCIRPAGHPRLWRLGRRAPGRVHDTAGGRWRNTRGVACATTLVQWQGGHPRELPGRVFGPPDFGDGARAP